MLEEEKRVENPLKYQIWSCHRCRTKDTQARHSPEPSRKKCTSCPRVLSFDFGLFGSRNISEEKCRVKGSQSEVRI